MVKIWQFEKTESLWMTRILLTKSDTEKWFLKRSYNHSHGAADNRRCFITATMILGLWMQLVWKPNNFACGQSIMQA